MDMIERCARAIWDANHGLGWDWADRPDQLDCLAAAKAAIEALREPTEAMVEVGTEARWKSAVRDANSVREIWAHMIDAALKEHERVK